MEEKKEEEIMENVSQEEKDTYENEAIEQEKVDVISNDSKPNNKKNLLFLMIGCVGVFVGVCLCLFLIKPLGGEKMKSIKQGASKYESEYRISGNSIENFDLAFLKIENENVNKIYSPLSIKYALQMLGEGSDGDTRAQIDAVIGDYKVRKYSNSEHMSFANAFFIRESFKDAIKKDYINTLSKKYNAEVVFDPFANASPINNWVKDKTFNLIDGIVDDDTVTNLNFALINSLAIDMNWNYLLEPASGASIPAMKYDTYYPHENYFDSVPTISKSYDGIEDYPAMTFNGQENTKSVIVASTINNYDIVKDLGEENIRKTVGDEYEEFLAGGGCGGDLSKEDFLNQYIKELNTNYHKVGNSTDYKMYDDESIKVFAKDLREYDGITLQYVGIMPKNIALADYIKNVTAKDLSEVIHNLKDITYDNFEEGAIINLKGNIPLFKYEYELKLIDDLKTLGIEDVFSEKANLSRLSSSPDQAIVEAKHKANIEFSNEGIKAAATTFLGGGGSASCAFDHIYDVPVKEIDLTFDKPYMYIIRDKSSGEVWFIGTVYEPEKR